MLKYSMHTLETGNCLLFSVKETEDFLKKINLPLHMELDELTFGFNNE